MYLKALKDGRNITVYEFKIASANKVKVLPCPLGI